MGKRAGFLTVNDFQSRLDNAETDVTMMSNEQLTAYTQDMTISEYRRFIKHLDYDIQRLARVRNGMIDVKAHMKDVIFSTINEAPEI